MNSKQEIIADLNVIKRQCESLINRVSHELPAEREWYNIQQAARETGLSKKTLSNYCGSGTIKKCKKDSRGRWNIHRSEIEKRK